MSISVPQPKTHVYSVLKNASGSVNVIAVVKFHRKPEKTKGSGFSLFISVTDPSLEGGKLPCVLFNNLKDKLPPIQSPGDVIVMHRLVIREFRGNVQGCGYANTGFTAAVFPGGVDTPLVPRLTPCPCSYGELEIARVKELRSWFHSPHCPVERELHDTSKSLEQRSLTHTTFEYNAFTSSLDPELISETPSTHVRRLWSLCPNEFVTIQGQIVSIYRHPGDGGCVVLYLWDGPCVTSTVTQSSIPRFFGLPKDHLAHLSLSASHNPELVAVTAHRLSDRFASTTHLIDWSVPVLVYDEHACNPPVTELVPGDLVQVNNAHVLRCRPPDCRVPGCLRVIVHGGGHKFARGVQRIGTMQMLLDYQRCIESNQPLSDSVQQTNQFNLLTQLRDGLLCRPCALQVSGSITVPLTISQLSNLPHQFNQIEAENFDLPFPTFGNPLTHTPIPRGSWMTLPEYHRISINKHRTAACVRLMARVQDICPKDIDYLRDLVLLACSECQSAVRISCLLDPNEEVCRCRHSEIGRSSKLLDSFTLIPFIFLTLEDPTGSLLLAASGKAALDLIRLPDVSWDRFVEELIMQRTEVCTTTNDDSFVEVDKVLNRIRSFQHQWINVLVRESWRTEWDIGVPTALDDLHLKFELLPFDESTSTTCE